MSCFPTCDGTLLARLRVALVLGALVPSSSSIPLPAMRFLPPQHRCIQMNITAPSRSSTSPPVYPSMMQYPIRMSLDGALMCIRMWLYQAMGMITRNPEQEIRKPPIPASFNLGVSVQQVVPIVMKARPIRVAIRDATIILRATSII